MDGSPSPPDRPFPSPWAELGQRLAGLMALLEAPSRDTPERIRRLIGGDDLRQEVCPLADGRTATLLYLESLVPRTQLRMEVLDPLSRPSFLREGPLPRRTVTSDRGLVQHLLDGEVAVLMPSGQAFTVSVQGPPSRSVGEPTTEKAVLGPKEAFVEQLTPNLALVRQRLKDPQLRVRIHRVGRRSQTRVALLYLEDVAPPRRVRRLERSLSQVTVDFLRTSMDLAELLVARTWTPFPLTEQTERPDRVAAALAQGRLALIVEGSPFALLLPVTFLEFQKDSEGDVQGPAVVWFVRALRLLGVLGALTVPGLYVALVSVNVSVMPLPLALALNTARIAVPYPALTETLIILLEVDILAEATVQAASNVGNTLAIVGTLIIGQTMVQAHLVSTLMLIVTAITVMGSFMTLRFPFSYGLRMWKYLLVLLAAFGGLVGWLTGLLFLLVHLASLKSAGVPYLAPLGPLNLRDLFGYGITQASKGRMTRRPRTWSPRDTVRARRRHPG